MKSDLLEVCLLEVCLLEVYLLEVYLLEVYLLEFSIFAGKFSDSGKLFTVFLKTICFYMFFDAIILFLNPFHDQIPEILALHTRKNHWFSYLCPIVFKF